MQSPSDDAPAEQQEPEYTGLDLSDYTAMWREAVDDYNEPRKQHYKDEEYYDGDVKGTGEGHWTTTELKTLADRNQPPVVFNLIKRKVNAIAGVEQRSRSEPRALPRNPQDQYSAEIATDALRYIKEQTRFESIKADASMEGIKIGYMAVEIGGEKDCVPITPIDWKDFFFDPRSRRPDFSDARYLGVAKWVDADVAKTLYVPPEIPQPQVPPQPQINDPAVLQQWAQMAQAIIGQWQQQVAQRQEMIALIDNTIDGAGSSTGGQLDSSDFEDRPACSFGDKKRKRIFVIDMWHKDPKSGWFRCVFTGGGKLFTEAATLIEKDQWGREVKTHPIIAQSIYVSKDLWRYGEVRGMRSPQDEYNARRSKAMHLLITKLLIYEPGAFVDGDVEKARKEIARPDGVLAVSQADKIKLLNNLDLAAGQQQLGAEARAFMELEGPNPQLQGIQAQAGSGRAILALQQAGLGQLGPIFDRLHDWESRCYRAMWARVQQFWDAPMYVRVTDDKNAARFAAVNGAPVVDNGNGNQNAPQDPRMGMGGNNGPPMMPGDMGEQGDPDQTPYGDPDEPHGMIGAPNRNPQTPMAGGAMAPMPQPGQQQTPAVGPMLADLDMDIIIDRAPEAATLQAEQFEQMGKMAQAGVFGPPNPEIARMMVVSSALPEKTKILEMLDKIASQPKPPPPELMAKLKTMEAQITNILAQADKARAEAAKISAGVPLVQAETERTSAEARTANNEATMGELHLGLPVHLPTPPLPVAPQMQPQPNQLGPGSPSIDPLAAGAQPGVIGSPPQTANGPPPF